MFKSNFTLFFVAALFLLTSACTSEKSKTSSNQMMEKKMAEMKKAPDFEVMTIDGQTVSLQKAMKANKPMVVYFTASWCPVCAKNWPELSKVYPEYKDKLTFVAIGIDPTDTEEVMRKLSMEKGFTFPVTAGHPQIMLDFGVETQATTVGINRKGYIAFQKNKTTLSADEFRSLFDELIN